MRRFLKDQSFRKILNLAAKVEKGTKITVVISKGPEELPPKKVPVEITIPYEPEVEGTPQMYVFIG